MQNCLSGHSHDLTSDQTLLLSLQGEGEVKILGRLIRHWYEPLGGEDTHGE